MNTNEDGKKADQNFENFVLEIEKKHGKGTIQVGNTVNKNISTFCSTGSHILDLSIGCGGIPKGRIIELYGSESSGKTLLSLHMIREVQKAGYKASFFDLENAFDPEWATNIGVDVDKLILPQVDTGSQVFDVCDKAATMGIVDLIIVDSVSAMITDAQLEGDYGEAHMAQLARLMSQSLVKLTPVLKKNNVTVVFINQLRDKIGTIYGAKETTQGGRALKYYSSIRLDIRRKSYIGDAEKPEGIESKIKVAKNKCGPPLRVTLLNFYFGKNGVYGINPVSEIVDLAVVNNIIQKRGAWYSYNEERIGQGRETAVAFLSKSEAMYSEIKKLVFETVMVKNKPTEGSFKDVVQKQVKEDTGNETK